MSTPAPKHESRPLTPQEFQWVQMQQAYFVGLVDQSGIDTDDLDTPEIADELVVWWHQQPATDRPEGEQVAKSIGIAVAAYLQYVLRIEFKRIDDEIGSTIGLVGDAEDGNVLVLFPVDSIIQRFAGADEGCVSDYLNSIWPRVKHLVKGMKE